MSGQLNHFPDSNNTFQGYGQQHYMMSTGKDSYSMMLGRNNHNGTVTNNTLQHNGTLSTNQFYMQDQGSTLRHIQSAGSNHPSDALSDRFNAFRPPPKTTKEYETLSKYKEKWRMLVNHMELWGRQTEDQKTLRFMHKILSQSMSAAINSSVENDEMAMLNKIFTSVKQFVCANQIPRSISGSSVISDRTFLDRGVNSTVGTQMFERPPSQTSQMSFQPMNTIASEGGDSQETSVAAPALRRRGRPLKHKQRLQEEMDAALKALDDNDNMDLFSASVTERLKEGDITSRDTTQTRPTPGTSKANKNPAKTSKPAKKVTPNSTNLNSKLNSNNIQRKEEDTPTGINAGKEKNDSSSGVKTTRNGRVVKSPNAYWKTNESKLDTRANTKGTKEKSPNFDLDESMTLRNQKIIVKGKTPPLPNSSKPLSTIAEDSNAPLPKTGQVSKSKPVAKKRKGKENVDASEARPLKNKKTSIETVKNNPTQLALAKKNEVTKVNKSEKANAKQVKKGSSKEIVGNIPKKKKIEHTLSQNVPPLDDYDDDGDELFSQVNYRKVQHTTKALSPSNGMSSVKKAVGTSQSKETPPCKAFAQLMNVTTHSTLSEASTSKAAPVSKITQVAKRVKKAMEHDKTKPIKPKASNAKTSKEIKQSSKLLGEVLSKHTSVTPLSKNMFLGSEPETDSEFNDSDIEDMDQDDLN